MRLLETDRDPLTQEAVIRIQRLLCASEDSVAMDLEERWLDESLTRHAAHMQAMVDEMRGELEPGEAEEFEEALRRHRVMSDYDAILRLATPWDSPLALVEFHDAWRDMESAFSIAQDYDYPSKDVTIATARHVGHNARAFAVLGSPLHVILFNERMFDFLHTIAALVEAAVAPENLEDGWNETGKASDPINLRLRLDGNPALDRAFDMFVDRHCRDVWDRTRTLAREALLTSTFGYELCQAAKYFVLGHEIAHLWLNHTDHHVLWPALNERDAPALMEYLPHHEEELDADLVGFELGMTACGKNRIRLEKFMWAVLLFFEANRWIERYWAIASHSPTDPEDAIRTNDTHPSLETRAGQMRELILMLGKDYALDELTRLSVAMLSRIDALFGPQPEQ